MQEHEFSTCTQGFHKKNNMKNSLLLPLLLLYALIAPAQIPNPSFENWTGMDPDGWFTGNSIQTEFVTKVTTSHAGTYAAQCNVIDVLGTPFSAPFAVGGVGEGVPSTAPEAIHGWYIMNSIGGDFGISTAGMFQNDTASGAGVANLTSTTVYKEFILNMYYFSGVPTGDSLFFGFIFSNATGSLHVGSYLVLDDLSFGALSGVEDVNSSALSMLEPIAPNPCSGNADIIYSLHSSSATSLNIYDMSGKLVLPLVNEKQSPGHYKAKADLSSLANGTYICRLTTDTGVDFQKLQLLH